jgi:hypothetical protein
MPTTWYVVPGDVAVATDASEAYGVSASVGFGELAAAASIIGELVVADSAVGVSAAMGVPKRSKAISTGAELLVADSAVAGVGDAGTDEVLG